MPGGSGLDLAAALREAAHRPAVIFTTAYPDYAVSAFDLDAADYRVKAADRIPVQRGDRTVLVEPVEVITRAPPAATPTSSLSTSASWSASRLSDLQRRLPGNFFRAHRSYLVNLDHRAPDFKGAHNLVTDDRQTSRVPVSRRQATPLRRHLGL